MIGSTRRRWLALLATAAAGSVLAATAGAASAQSAGSCGILTAAGHPWIVVAKGVPCSTVNRVVRGFAARTAALHNGQNANVHSPLKGFHCVIASHGKPSGSCSNVGATKNFVWLVAS